jgi:hypothetical protein
MAERSVELRWLLWRSGASFLRRIDAARQREEAGREAWLAGVQKRLGLLTRGNVDELVGVRLEALGGVMWPS